MLNLHYPQAEGMIRKMIQQGRDDGKSGVALESFVHDEVVDYLSDNHGVDPTDDEALDAIEDDVKQILQQEEDANGEE